MSQEPSTSEDGTTGPESQEENDFSSPRPKAPKAKRQRRLPLIEEEEETGVFPEPIVVPRPMFKQGARASGLRRSKPRSVVFIPKELWSEDHIQHWAKCNGVKLTQAKAHSLGSWIQEELDEAKSE